MAQKLGKKKRDGQTKKSGAIKILIKMEAVLKNSLKAGLSAIGGFLARKTREARENKLGLLNLGISLTILSKVNQIQATLNEMIDGLNNAFFLVIIQMQAMGAQVRSGLEAIAALFGLDGI